LILSPSIVIAQYSPSYNDEGSSFRNSLVSWLYKTGINIMLPNSLLLEYF